jgi:hypothetical protein
MKMLISGGAVIPSHEVEKLKREQKKADPAPKAKAYCEKESI